MHCLKIDRLLEELYRGLHRRRGRAYARWVVAHWREQMTEQSAWIAHEGEDEVGFLTVRSPSPGKGEMVLLYSGDRDAEIPLVDGAFLAFRERGFDLVTTAFQSWDHLFDRTGERIGEWLSRSGFGRFEVRVLEVEPAEVVNRPPADSPDGYRIRPMQRFDLDGCAELMHASPDPLMRAVRYPIEECRRILEWSAGRRGRFAPDLAGVAIGPSGRVSGFVTVNPSGVIGQVYIDRTARRQGLARFLVERGLRGLAGRSVDRAILTAIEGNAPAQALYRSIGFEEIYRYPVRYWKDSGEPR